MTEIAAAGDMLLEAATQKQREAADPRVSAWVRANAGTGKTHVLVNRMLRLLLSGAPARAILCLTYTKNAAAEMEGRVLKELGRWAAASGPELEQELAALLDRTPSAAERATARCLFASVIDAPGGLGIMTIHGFCERVLRRYALEANVPPGFTVLTEEEAQEVLNQAIEDGLGAAGDALDTIAAHAGAGDFAQVLRAMLAERSKLTNLFASRTSGHPPVEELLRAWFGLDANETPAALLAAGARLLAPSTLREAVAVLEEGSKNDIEGAKRLQSVRCAKTDEARFAALRDTFFTGTHEPRKALMTAATRARAAALDTSLRAAQDVFIRIEDKLSAAKAVEATGALLQVTEAIFARFDAGKRARAALDFDDLIAKTLALLSREGAAEWVLYQLDARIDHLLVDEAQDTSPAQWDILSLLTADFFAGESARECVPTIFAVGDEKQSIYGFQGAAPELLAANGAFYEARCREAQRDWRTIDLNLSFRTLEPILAAVDSVRGALPGLDGVPHLPFRREGHGIVELWEPERAGKQAAGSVWDPEADEEAPLTPAEALANRIAGRIAQWLGDGDCVGGDPLQPGDILILLRKREPMTTLLQSALDKRRIPACGADRFRLLDSLAVLDLLALAEALLLPSDDLSLAAVLLGPLFRLADAELFDLAHGRQGSLWEALQQADAAPIVKIAATLRSWRELAFSKAPFDFFAHVLDAEGGRAAFAGALGAQCHDALDELLALAERFGARGEPCLDGFVPFLRKSASEVKRETAQAAREVRVMTVHGAKGLEAKIVILADACALGGADPPPIYFIDHATGGFAIPIWAVKGSLDLAPIREAKAARKEALRQEAERLLYVAMTRARDRLYVTGSHAAPEPPRDCWYDILFRALGSRLSESADFAGRKVWRLGSDAQAAAAGAAGDEHLAPLPAWIGTAPPAEAALDIRAPSRLLPLRDPEEPGPRLSSRAEARAAGVLTHRLLELLPGLEAERRPAVAELIASAFAADLPLRQRQGLVRTALELLADPALCPFFRTGLAETGLAVEIEAEEGGFPTVLLGQADRVAIGDGEITVLDYKSGQRSHDAGAHENHLAQLAAYRLALQRLFTGRRVKAALLDTRSMTLVPAASLALDAALAKAREEGDCPAREEVSAMRRGAESGS